MKHTDKFLLAVIFLIACLWCFAAEPQDSVNNDYSALEARVTAIEERLDSVEERIGNPNFRVPPNQTNDDNDPSELSKIKVKREIQSLESAIKRDAKRIEKISPRYLFIRRTDADGLLKALDTAKKNRNICIKQEDRISRLIRLAEVNPDVDMDIEELKEQQLDLQIKREIADEELEKVRKVIEHNRDLFNILPK